MRKDLDLVFYDLCPIICIGLVTVVVVVVLVVVVVVVVIKVVEIVLMEK